MGRYDALTNLEELPKPPKAKPPTSKRISDERYIGFPASQQKSDGGKAFQVTPYQSVDKSTDRSIGQSVGRLTNQPTPNATTSSNKIVDRPKSFYITERLDKRLDEAVRYFQEVHGIKKADRSTIVNAVMDNEEQWREKSLDQLVNRLISQLTSRLTGK